MSRRRIAHYVSGSNPRRLIYESQIAYDSVSRSRQVGGSNPSYLPSVCNHMQAGLTVSWLRMAYKVGGSNPGSVPPVWHSSKLLNIL